MFESNEPLTDSCPVRTRNTGGGNSESSGGFPCARAPVRHLRPDGILVTWSTSDDAPGSRALSPAGHRERIGAEPAWVYSGPASGRTADLGIGAGPGTRHGGMTGPSCSQIGATQVITATISLGPAPGDADQMLACLRGPDTGPATAEIHAMLGSLRFTS